MMNPDADPWGAAAAAADSLREELNVDRFDAALVLGSGWAAAAETLGDTIAEVPLAGRFGFPPPTVAGHGSAVRAVEADGQRALVFLGRVHAYEGHSPAVVVHGVRAAAAAGARVVILTNAAGSIREHLQPGTPVMISDHLNLTGRSPLSGPEPPPPYGARFCDLTDLYSARLREIVRSVAPDMAEGVYAGLSGPHYETPAEIRMLRTLGADLVGMSTVLEAIAARHAGAEVLGISLVTNLAAGIGAEPLDHAEVLAVGQQSAERVATMLRRLLPNVGELGS